LTDKILFVDDDANLLASFRRQLRKKYQIETALGGPEGLELVNQNGPYAVIVSDFRMPHMDGIEFLSRVREIAPDTVRIMLTGNADMQAAIQAVNEGNIFRFLTKPCAVDLLGESLNTGIDQYRRVRQEREYNERSRHSLAQAMDVQQNLIPKEDPVVDGLDIAGQCIFCDETGGDYYDYLNRGQIAEGKLCVLVGDVSDHGVGSALLMTSARAFLRERSSKPGSIAGIVSDVNRQLARDVEMTDRFMTLFYSEIDVADKQFCWVRAGHDPAIVYDPKTDEFEELKGQGIPLGVMEDTKYQESEYQFSEGQIIVITTDGICEAPDANGVMFGKDRLYHIIRNNAGNSAKEIVSTIMKNFKQFIEPMPQKDDATAVVIKVDSKRIRYTGVKPIKALRTG
jgi:serine phosphatase RsbU (regulator of sigma subunit)